MKPHPQNPLPLEEIHVTVKVSSANSDVTVTSRWLAKEIQSVPFSSLGSSFQRICYEMLERAAGEVAGK